MENKYYTPKIEDFHVGFEYEIEPAHIKEGEPWIKEKWHIHNFSEGRFKAQLNTNSIRVPYLTKEQIEAEGWLLEENTSMDKGNLIFMHPTFQYENNPDYKLFLSLRQQYNEDRSTKLMLSIYIQKGEVLDQEHYFLYRGIAKSINEFRTVCKWLEI